MKMKFVLELVSPPEDLTLDVDMPFVPRPGLMLKLAQEGDYFPVEQVFYNHANGEFEVFLDPSDNPQIDSRVVRKRLRKEGWKPRELENGGRHEHQRAPTR